MAVFSVIKKSELEGAQRIDAEYYQPEFLSAKQKLEQLPYWILGEHAFITDGEHGSVEFGEGGVKYLTAENISDGFLELDGIRYVSDRVDLRNRRASLQSHDLTISIKGSVGLAALVFKNDLPANMNRDVARIHIKELINPFYLAVFLNSRFGRRQTLRESSGNVQQMATLGRLRELLIPIANSGLQARIQSIYLEARGELEKSFEFYEEAEQSLLIELNLEELGFGDELSYVVNFAETGERADAEYFQPKYKKLLQKLGDSKRLGELAPRQIKQTSAQRDKTYSYIEISDINAGTGEAGYHIVESPELPANAKLEISGGELLISKVRPTRGAISIIPDDWQTDFVASGAFSIFKLPSPLREYIQVVLRSFIGKLQLERPTTGTSYPTITDSDVENVMIPILPQATQEKIGDLVRQSHAARRKSKQLLEQAKREVEALIED